MTAHAQVGREIEAARTIPARKDNEIHNKGMGGFYFSFTRAFREGELCLLNSIRAWICEPA